jgi:hypothetical protein
MKRSAIVRSQNIAIVVLIAGLSLGPIVQAQIYEWTDEQGNVHFGDKPEDPESASEAEAVDLKLNYEPQERTPEELEALKRQRQTEAVAGQQRLEAQEQARIEEKRARQEQKAAQCRALDEEISRLGRAKRINGRRLIVYIEGEDGQSISEEEQRERVEELQRKRKTLGCD